MTRTPVRQSLSETARTAYSNRTAKSPRVDPMTVTSGTPMTATGRTEPPMNNGEQSRTGGAMRRRVRRATVAVVGAAVLATGMVTAGMAYANGTADRHSPSTDQHGRRPPAQPRTPPATLDQR